MELRIEKSWMQKGLPLFLENLNTLININRSFSKGKGCAEQYIFFDPKTPGFEGERIAGVF